jgi:FkbM family methyltransferase
MEYIKQKDIEWKLVDYLRQGETRIYDYVLQLNEPLASWDVWDYWERERIISMRNNLTKKDILFDIGTEQGWCNLVYADMVGPKNMVLIEPTQEFWGNIYALWYKNYDVDPLACYNGFFSNRTTETRTKKGLQGWHGSEKMDIIDRNKYQYLHDNIDNVPQIRIDDYIELTGIKPTALTMDTEGSELLILLGAEKLLKENDIKLWVSIHDDLGRRDYNVKPEDTIKFLEDLGYHGTLLATNHEQHWYFRKVDNG